MNLLHQLDILQLQLLVINIQIANNNPQRLYFLLIDLLYRIILTRQNLILPLNDQQLRFQFTNTVFIILDLVTTYSLFLDVVKALELELG